MNPFFVALGLLGGGLVIAAIYYPVWLILHYKLSSRLDGMLFKKPYFRDSELINYQHAPLSLVKSINYIYLVGFPALAKRRRFKSLSAPLPVGPGLTLICKIHFSLGVLAGLLLISFFVYTIFILALQNP